MNDIQVAELLRLEYSKHKEKIELIASENFISSDVLQALSSITANKLAEGYCRKRFNTGCEYVDQIEELGIQRLKELFNCEYANIQPHSGSQANQAVFLGLLKPGDTFLAMSMDSGGHLTHGLQSNLSGKWFNPIHYSVDKKTKLLDYNVIEDLAKKYKPKLIITGHSSYSRFIDYQKVREIANKVSAFFLADIAHTAGIIAAGQETNPIYYADVVTSTTHKTIRGPRGGMMMSNNPDLFKILDSSLFPGIQSAVLLNVITAKTITFGEALQDSFKNYIDNVLKNAKALAKTLISRGYSILTGNTENHIVVVDLSNKGINGKEASERLDLAGISSNKQSIPFDKNSPILTSGLRFGSPACTTRGMKEPEFIKIANLIADVLDEFIENKDINKALEKTKVEVRQLATQFTIF
jgi:glycine hydroxymethyltransferase